jgi:hypothetical protein
VQELERLVEALLKGSLCENYMGKFVFNVKDFHQDQLCAG